MKTSLVHPHRKSLLRLLGILLCVAVLLSACGSRVTPTPAVTLTSVSIPTTEPTRVVIDLNQLHATPWTLVSFGDPANPTVVEEGLKITLDITPDGQVSGFGGCNTYNGTVQIADNGTITVSPLATTRMACEQGMDQESAYLAALQNARSLSFNSQGRLEIKYGPEDNANQVLVYAVGEKPLAGTHWALVSYGDPATPETLPAGIVITAVFTEDGVVSGFSGCNQYSGSYTIQDSSLSVGPVAATQMMCAPEIMEVEQTYLAALGTAQKASITGQVLAVAYNQDTGALTYTSASLPLDYTLWALTHINDQPVPAESAITAIFTPGKNPNAGLVSGFSGCNTYSAGYTEDGNTLTVQTAATTMMVCPTGMDSEQAYMQALQTTNSYQIIVDTLILTNPSGRLTYSANRTPLSGALWVLVSLGDVKNPVKPVEESQFRAQFNSIPNYPSGVLTGTTGCNEYTAAYTASPTEININQPVSTNNTSCVPGLADQEKLFYLALSDAKTYRITGNTLIIPYDSNKQALVFEGTGTELSVAKRPPLSELNGTTWHLWYINNNPVLAGTSVYAQFVINPDGASGTMSGSAGCNNYVASFGNDLGVKTALNATQNCSQPAGVMDQEKTYLDMLSRTYGYWQTGNQLIINTGKGPLTYGTEKPPSSADQTHLLVGKTWYLVAYKNTYSLPGTQEPYTLFNSDGTLTGYTGCNAFQANYSTAVQQITITNLSAQKSACPSSSLQAQEQAMLEILGTANSYQVVGTVMQLLSAGGVLNYSLTPMNRPQEIVPPTAVIKGPTDAPVNQVVNFDGTASTGQAPIVSWVWDYGDGIRGSGPFVSHVYGNPATYSVMLTVTDQRGYQNSTTMKITIYTVVTPTPTQPPQPTATTQPTATLAPTQAPTATQAPGPTATSQPTQTSQPTATLAPTQTPQPTATIAPAPTQLPVIPPQAVIQGPGQGFVGEPVTFDASASTAGSSPIASYAWDFGDGSTAAPSDSPTQSAIYNQAGTYQVSVVVTDQSGLSSSATMQIAISAKITTPTEWTLSQLNGQPLLPGTAITMTLQGGSLSGFAGCNSYTGGYTATQTGEGTYNVTVTGVTVTQMMCPEEIMAQERTYLSMLSTTTAAQIQGATLDLSTSQGSLTYAQAATPK